MISSFYVPCVIIGVLDMVLKRNKFLLCRASICWGCCFLLEVFITSHMCMYFICTECMHAHAHTCTWMDMFMHVLTWVHMFSFVIHFHLHICIHAVFVQMHVQMYLYLHALKYVRLAECLYVCLCVSMYVSVLFQYTFLEWICWVRVWKFKAFHTYYQIVL